MPVRHPVALPRDGTIAVICPASPVERTILDRGIARLREIGFHVVEGVSCSARGGLWAGTDTTRADEMIGWLMDPEIDAIFAGRGGVGCSRLLPHLARLPADLPPKWIVGRSDLTALQVSLWSDRRWVGLSGPMVATDFGGEEPPLAHVVETTLQLLCETDSTRRFAPASLRSWRPGEAEGRIVPANLSLLASMAGTPYVPDLRGSIVVLEEVNEPPQRIDRMLTQLRMARVLDCLSGLVYGQFTRCASREWSQGAGILDSVLRDHADRLGVPTLAGFPYGHEADFIPLPIGVRAALRQNPPVLEILEAAASRGEDA